VDKGVLVSISVVWIAPAILAWPVLQNIAHWHYVEYRQSVLFCYNNYPHVIDFCTLQAIPLRLRKAISVALVAWYLAWGTSRLV